MASPKQKVIDALTELEILQAERDSLETKRERATRKFREEFEAATAPVNQKFDSQILPVQERIAALTKEIEAAMLMNLDADGNPKLTKAASENLQAEVVQSAARREVEAEAFFNFVPALQRRGSSFWNCFSVQIAKAEKFLGEKINEIATLKKNFKVVIRPK